MIRIYRSSSNGNSSDFITYLVSILRIIKWVRQPKPHVRLFFPNSILICFFNAWIFVEMFKFTTEYIDVLLLEQSNLNWLVVYHLRQDLIKATYFIGLQSSCLKNGIVYRNVRQVTYTVISAELIYISTEDLDRFDVILAQKQGA